jgi:beta-galactosidase/beta-glucuronidase
VWIDGVYAGEHEGGYTPFSIDVTRAFQEGGDHEIVVLAEDDPHDLAKPRGKQDWKLDPHSIWYPRTTGIWQTVWLERTPATRIAALRWTCNLDRWEISLDAEVAGPARDDLELSVRLTANGRLLVKDVYAIFQGEVHRRMALADPGIDDLRNELLWSPVSPRLLDAELELRAGVVVLDRVKSYTALRSLATKGGRFVLNGRPTPLRFVLDQGYWPETGLTAPDDDALRRDVELAKEMGFNGVRKHQKIEDPRYLYWCDRLGLLVWEEMPSAYRFTQQSVQRLTTQWLEAIRRDFSHPCIVTWVPFNESWGVPNLPDSAAERHWVESLYHLTKTIDPSRPVIGNDGWETVAADLVGIHDYELRPERLVARYAVPAPTIHHEQHRSRLLASERPGGRALALPGYSYPDQPLVLTEFGGISYAPPGKGDAIWGYGLAKSPEELGERYSALLAAIHALPILGGYCYTQLSDTYQEANGLLYADRTPKFPMEAIRRATQGPPET